MRIFLAFVLPLIALIVAPTQAFAQSIVNCNQAGQFQALCLLQASNFGEKIVFLINFAFVIAIIIALFYLVWGGIKWVTSGGDKSNVETARNHIIAAVVGLIFVFLSYLILNLLLYFFTGKGLQDITIPKLP